jgi:hypothetical protein
MHIDEIINLVNGEPARFVTRNVRVPSPQTLSIASKPGGLSLTEFLSAPATMEQKDVRYSHILGAPASREAIEAWAKQHPTHPLPVDLQALVARINGIHLWANAETGRSYEGLAPIEEWELARTKMYGPTADRALLDDRFVALSYHQDGAAFVVLDIVTEKYFLMDAAGPEATSPIANDGGELLDWLWRNRIAPKG